MTPAQSILKHILEDDDDFGVNDLDDIDDSGPYLPLGTIIHGTMRDEDIMPALLSVLRHIDPEKANEVEKDYADEIKSYDEYFCNERLYDILGEYAPPYTYVGSSEGDGSDIGVWISFDSLTDALKYEDESLTSFHEGEVMDTSKDYAVLLDKRDDPVALYNARTGKELWRT